MTEAAWRACPDPHIMLNRHSSPWLRLDREIRESKERLFACACCRRLWHLLDAPYRDCVQRSERFAGRELAETEMRAWFGHLSGLKPPVREDLLGAATAVHRLFACWDGRSLTPRLYPHQVAELSRNALAKEAERRAFSEGRSQWEARGVAAEVARTETHYQADLLRDLLLVGGPPLNQPREGVSKTVRALAQAVFDGDEGAVGPLRDALLESGLLEFANHFEQPPHPPGCWAIDLLLGKSQ